MKMMDIREKILKELDNKPGDTFPYRQLLVP